MLMILPVVFLAGVGFLMRGRKPATLVMHSASGPFEPYVKRVRIVRASAQDVFDGYDSKWIVELDAHGRKPVWWNKGFGGRVGMSDGKLVRRRDATIKSLGRSAYLWTPRRNPDGTWEAEYKARLADVAPRAGEIRLHHKLWFEDSGRKLAPVWIDIPLRPYGKATKTPVVSRVSQLKIAKFFIEPTPPVSAHGNQGTVRVRWIINKLATREEAKKSSSGLSFNVDIHDKRGNTVGHMGEEIWGSAETAFPTNAPPSAVPNPRRQGIITNYVLDKGLASATEPLWLQGTARWNDAWPLAIKIPLRDAKGQFLWTIQQRAKPLFRVVATGIATPTTDEIGLYGCDTMARITLQSLDAKTDVSGWNWDGDYSQHLVDASKKELWEFAFKGGMQPIGVGYEVGIGTSKVTLSYPLILKLIPAAEGKLVFKAEIGANNSARVPVAMIVRP